MAPLLPVSVPAVIKDMAGKNLAKTLRNFDSHYMPNGQPDPEFMRPGSTLHIVQIWTVKHMEFPEVSAKFSRSWHMEINFDVHGAIDNDQVWILVYLFASK